MNINQKHTEWSRYAWRSKNDLIKIVIEYITYIKKKNEYIKGLILENQRLQGELEEEIYSLKEFIDLQKQEINELLNYKKEKNFSSIRKTYLMKDNYTGLYKIGFSNNPNQREKTLQSENPSILMVKIWDKNIEKELHYLYREFRIRGEWFKLNEVQVKYICTNF